MSEKGGENVAPFARTCDEALGTTNVDEQVKPDTEPAASTPDRRVEVVPKGSPSKGRANRAEWFKIEIHNMDGKEVHLLALPEATVLQMKRAVEQADGISACLQTFWAEGVETELENTLTFAESGLEDGSKIFMILGEAATWQLVVLNEPELFDALNDFMALSLWREEGGYQQAGAVMQDKLQEWEEQLEAKALSLSELLRRKVVVGRFFVDCGGQFELAIGVLQAVADKIEMDALQSAMAALVENPDRDDLAPAGDFDEQGSKLLSLPDQARLHFTLGAAYSKREQAKSVGIGIGGYSYFNFMKAAKAHEMSASLWRAVAQGKVGKAKTAESKTSNEGAGGAKSPEEADTSGSSSPIRITGTTTPPAGAAGAGASAGGGAAAAGGGGDAAVAAAAAGGGACNTGTTMPPVNEIDEAMMAEALRGFAFAHSQVVLVLSIGS
jgi:hypothetical protein